MYIGYFNTSKSVQSCTYVTYNYSLIFFNKTHLLTSYNNYTIFQKKNIIIV